jgi:hypothetical protein
MPSWAHASEGPAVVPEYRNEHDIAIPKDRVATSSTSSMRWPTTMVEEWASPTTALLHALRQFFCSAATPGNRLSCQHLTHGVSAVLGPNPDQSQC